MRGIKNANKTYCLRMPQELEDAIYIYRARHAECRQMDRSGVMRQLMIKQLVQEGILVKKLDTPRGQAAAQRVKGRRDPDGNH